MGRVLHITDKPPGGGGLRQSVETQMQLARDAGWQAGLLRIGGAAQADAASGAAPADEGAATLPLAYTRRQRPAARAVAALHAYMERTGKPDVIHLHLGLTALSPALVEAMATQATLLVQLHDVAPFCPKGTRLRQTSKAGTSAGTNAGTSVAQCAHAPGLACARQACAGDGGWLRMAHAMALWPTRRAIWQALCRHAALILAPSGYLADLARNAGAPRLHCLPHAVDLTPPADLPPPSDCPPRLLYAGRLDPLKGPQLALAALAHLPGDTTLAICGDGPARAALEHEAQRLGLGPRVTFHGWCDRADLGRQMGQARAVLHPSLVPEGFGLSIIEANALGRPVAGFGAGASAALLATPNARATQPSPQALARAAAPWLTDPARADADGRAAQAMARAYAPDRIGAELAALYAGLTGADEAPHTATARPPEPQPEPHPNPQTQPQTEPQKARA